MVDPRCRFRVDEQAIARAIDLATANGQMRGELDVDAGGESAEWHDLAIGAGQSEILVGVLKVQVFDDDMGGPISPARSLRPADDEDPEILKDRASPRRAWLGHGVLSVENGPRACHRIRNAADGDGLRRGAAV